jgi:uncharacterized NAD(P)/FAD-binding protein YdhS
MRHGLQGSAEGGAGDSPSGCTDDHPAAAATPADDLGTGDGTRPLVVVVGAGAAGALVAIHLTDRQARTGAAPLDLLLVDPDPRPGRGVAYSTTDPRHLLNVPAQGMSALPGRPTHFLDWVRHEVWHDAAPCDFVPRSEYAHYLDATLTERRAAAPGVRLAHRRTSVTSVRPTPAGVRVELEGGQLLTADAVVVATGLQPPGTDWAPAALRASARFVADPWAPGALDALRERSGDLLLVGTGLTMVDLALTLGGDGRTLHAVSRRGRVPAAHTSRAARPAPECDEVLESLADALADRAAGLARTDLAELRELVRDAVTASVRSRGDWRVAFDTLRPLTGDLWAALDGGDRAEFLDHDAAWWDLHRHRMPLTSAAAVARLRASGALRISSDEVLDATETADGVAVTLASGRTLTVAAVVNCTGPLGDVRRSADPLHRDLLAQGTAVAGPLGLGVRTHAGRLVDATHAHTAPVWTIGALRRGELWESTAIPEIRAQAAAVADDVLDALCATPPSGGSGSRNRGISGAEATTRGQVRRRATDVMGLPISTGREAAAAFNRGVDAVMRVQSGAPEAFAEAVRLDPGFALGHAALAMLGHEGGAATVDVQRSLDAARRAVREQGTERERSLVDVVGSRVGDCRGTGAKALISHVHAHPRDVLAVSAAVPTIAFSGVTDVQQDAWDLVEGLTPAYAGHWFHRSLLAFVRQDQARYDEAGALAEQVLSLEPAAGHAVHARTHVYYETGDHQAGLRWLDPWITTCGRQASHRAHFSWHAALHELSTGDADAVRRRYLGQLAPPSVTGVRGLVDSASLLWRCKVTDSWPGALPVDDVLAYAGEELVERPETPFTALHSAVALTAAGDTTRLVSLRRHAADAADPVMRDVVAPLCDGLLAVVEARWDDAVRLIRPLLPRLTPVGGSRAQREIVEDTYLYALVGARRCAEAVALLDARLGRRTSPLDLRRRRTAAATPA